MAREWRSPSCAIDCSDPSDSTKGTQGMGIGAYQMRETVRSMGGDVAVSSNTGEGTVVSMTLRIADN